MIYLSQVDKAATGANMVSASMAQGHHYVIAPAAYLGHRILHLVQWQMGALAFGRGI
ncbi:MAG: hypothetical protein ACREYF_02855 [Gammaproteobacteria bacterium]